MENFLSFTTTFIWVFRKVVDILSVCLLVAMIGLIFAQILGRYVFNYSIAWSEELATFVQVWLVMLGAGIAMRKGQHVGIDILVARCSLLIQRLVKLSSLILIVWFLVVVVMGSISMITIGLIIKSPALQIPMAIPYIALPVGMSYFVLELLIFTLPKIFSLGSNGSVEGNDL